MKSVRGRIEGLRGNKYIKKVWGLKDGTGGLREISKEGRKEKEDNVWEGLMTMAEKYTIKVEKWTLCSLKSVCDCVEVSTYSSD